MDNHIDYTKIRPIYNDPRCQYRYRNGPLTPIQCIRPAAPGERYCVNCRRYINERPLP